ncbi:unnamed protein product, partial [marine sediment metagenome]
MTTGSIPKYQWLVDRLEQEFPEDRVIPEVFQYGAGFSITVARGVERATYLIEGLTSSGGVEQLMHEDEYDESSLMIMRPGPPYKTNITGLPNSSDPERFVNDMIRDI